MTKEFINPNWHVILIHLPLGVFVMGVLIELFSFLYRDSAIRIVARGMIWLGALSTLPAAYSGVYAFANVVRMELPAEAGGDPEGRPWHETAAAASGPGGLNEHQWEYLGRHAWAQGSSAVLAALLVTIGFGASDRWRQKLQVPIMAGLVLALVAMAWGAYFGGEMVYRYGTGVNVVQEKGAMPEASAPTTTDSAAQEQTEVKAGVERYVPPLQLHVTLAGVAAALSLAALGMSMRVMSTADAWRDTEVAPARNLLDLESGPRDDYDLDRTSPDPDSGAGPHGIPSARFWLLAALTGGLAALAGWWFLGGLDETGTWQPQALWQAVAQHQRRLYHVIGAGVLFVLPLILALIARFARRSKFLLGLFSLLLIASLGAQAWLGVLLMFDTPNGSVFRFNPAGEIAVSTEAE